MVMEMLLLLAQLLVLRVVVTQVQDQLSHQENRDKIETVTLLKKKGWTLRLLHIDIKRFVYNTYVAFLRYLKKACFLTSHWAYLINDTDIEALF